MKQTALAALYLSIIVVLAPVPSSAETVLYNNIEASNFGTPYASSSFNIVTGSYLEGSDQGDAVIGQQFTLSSASNVNSILLPLASEVGPSVQMDVYLLSDSGGAPNTIIASLLQAGVIEHYLNPTTGKPQGALVAFGCGASVCDLAAGSYWIVAMDPIPETVEIWASTPIFSMDDTAINYLSSPTGPWSFTGPGAALGFAVEGTMDVTPTPEPSSLLLFGSGLLGLAGLVSVRKFQKIAGYPRSR